MSAEERETLSLGLARGHSLRTMVTVLRRAPSTVSREHARYRACTAQMLAIARACQPRRPRTLLDPWLRQYLPKGTDLSGHTQRELNAIAHRLNTRPRKCLNFATPLEVYAHLRHYSPIALGT